MSEPKYQQAYNPLGENIEVAQRACPDDLTQCGLRIVSDGTPIGTHFIVYDAKTGQDLCELGNVQQFEVQSSIDDMLNEVKLLCVPVPMRLDCKKPVYAMGSPDPLTERRLQLEGKSHAGN